MSDLRTRTYLAWLPLAAAKLGTALRRGHAVRWLDEESFDLWVNGRKGNLRDLRDELPRTVGRIKLTARGNLVQSDRREGEPFPFGVAVGIEVK